MRYLGEYCGFDFIEHGDNLMIVRHYGYWGPLPEFAKLCLASAEANPATVQSGELGDIILRALSPTRRTGDADRKAPAHAEKLAPLAEWMNSDHGIKGMK